MNKHILEDIKTKSWQNKIDVDAENGLWVSINQILAQLEKPFNAEEVAQKCVEKATPGSKYWGMTVNEIIDSWQKKANIGSSRGSELDTYIQCTLHNKPRPIIEDPILLQKCKHFDDFKTKIIDHNNIELIGTEIWLTSKKYKFRGRCDALFLHKDAILIFDWKNNEVFNTNQFEKMLGPCDHLFKSDLGKYTLQLYMYRYILNEIGYNVKMERVIQFTEKEYKIHKPLFEYVPEFMESIFEYAISKIHKKYA